MNIITQINVSDKSFNEKYIQLYYLQRKTLWSMEYDEKIIYFIMSYKILKYMYI